MSNDFVDMMSSGVLVLDGAMSTMLHAGSKVYPVERLVLDNPDIVMDMHRTYVNAGADIITTNSFGAYEAALERYGLEDRAERINCEAVRLARAVADECSERRVFVAGSMSCGFVPITLHGGVSDYLGHDSLEMQAKWLFNAGIDVLFIETVYDINNARCAAKAAANALKCCGRSGVPVVMSVTVDDSGHTLSGHSPMEVYDAVYDIVRLCAFGLNCCTGVWGLVRAAYNLLKLPVPLVLYPNAGVPDADGCYASDIGEFVRIMEQVVATGKVGIVGGCCGTTPGHIKDLACMVKKHSRSYGPRV